MKVISRNYGSLEVQERDIITFSEPIYGFDEYRKFAKIALPEMGEQLCSIQSIDDEALSFALIKPEVVVQDYVFRISNGVKDALELTQQSQPECWLVTIVPEDFTKSTANLKSPIIINTENNLAMQLILEEEYPIRAPIFKAERVG